MRHQTHSMIFLLALISIPALSWGWQGQVVNISNGDAITVLHNGIEEKVFLYGIKCPRQQQNLGPESKRFTSQMVTGRIIDVRPVIIDSQGRTFAIVGVDGMIINEELARAGLARVQVQHCKDDDCPILIKNQEVAQIEKIGLWSTENPPALSEFYRENNPLVITVPDSSRPTPASEEVHGNIVTHIFYELGCKDYDCPKCIAHFKSRNQALRAGYKPSEECNP